MINNYMGEKDIVAFSEVVNKMRQFCLSKGFVEVNTQDRLSILAACEDPTTVATYNYAGEVWPLPQTVLAGVRAFDSSGIAWSFLREHEL